jgi:hypothetical protein
MGRRVKADTAAGAIKAMVNASKDALEPPAHVRLRPDDLPFWAGIMASRARDEWSEADLVVGAQLARCQHDIEVESILLEAESTIIQNERGTMVYNPRVTVLEQLTRRETMLMRTLRMGGRIAGSAHEETRARGVEKQSKKIRAELEDEDLLAA